MLEVLAATFILALVLLTVMSLFGTGTSMFARTARSAYTEADAIRVARLVENELSEACYYYVSADGRTVYYFLLEKDAAGIPVRNPGNATSPQTPLQPKVQLNGSTFRRYNFSVQGSNPPYTLKWSERTLPVLTGLPSATVFGPANTRSANGTNTVITATIASEQQYSSGGGALKTASKTALVRVIPRNVNALAVAPNTRNRLYQQTLGL